MCEQREQLLDYLYDEGTPENRRSMERHIESCDDCREELRTFRGVREDLLAWDVPNPPSVWKAFAPAPVVPWHKQVPAWAMAAAASLMFVVGSAGGFVAHSVVDGSSGAGSAAGSSLVPVELKQASAVDTQAILSLIREELAHANQDAPGQAIAVSNTRPYQLDTKTEERLLDRMNTLVNESQNRQLTMLGDYLFKVRQEDEVRRRDAGIRMSQITAELENLKAVVNTLQAKVQ
jgi:hypothetical protein